MQHLFRLSLCLFFLTAFVQCTSQDDGKTRLTFWVMPNSPEPQRDIERLVADFEAQHPDIDVVVVVIDWGAAWTKITTAAISGVAPDLCQIGTTWVGAITSMDALLELDKYLSEIGDGKGFVPASWATAGIAGSGHISTIPWFVDVRACYYRTDIFRKLHLTKDDLRDWDSFLCTLRKIKQARLVIDGVRVVPLGYPGKNDWNVIHNLAPWIWAAGGSFLSSDLKYCTLDQPEALQGIQFYLNLVLEGLVPIECLELNSAQVEANFNNGRYAIAFSGAHEDRLLNRPPELGGGGNTIAAHNYGIALYPVGPKGRFQFFGGSNLGIFRASKHADATWELIKYLTTPEKQIEYCKVTGFMPAVLAAYDDPYISQDSRRTVFREAIRYGRSYPCVPVWGPMEPILMRRFGNLFDLVAGVYGPFTEEKLLTEIKSAVAEVNALLEETR